MKQIASAVIVAAATFSLSAPAAGQNREPYPVVQFRFVNPDQRPPSFEVTRPIRLLADEDFPPFSFRGGDGVLEGIAVDSAMEACRELGARCEVIARPWAGLMAAFEAGEGDAIISGPRIDADLAARHLVTRPFFRATARFAVRTEIPLESADIRTLAGKRIGAAKGSAHAAWIAANFPQSALTEFENDSAAFDALRTGAVDAAFGDGLRLLFWSRGSAARGCCRLLPGAFIDDALLSPAMGVVVAAERDDLMRAFDYGLDRVQMTGAFATIFRRYVPASPW